MGWDEMAERRRGVVEIGWGCRVSFVKRSRLREWKLIATVSSFPESIITQSLRVLSGSRGTISLKKLSEPKQTESRQWTQKTAQAGGKKSSGRVRRCPEDKHCRGSFSDFRSFEMEDDPLCIHPLLLAFLFFPSHYKKVRQLRATDVTISPPSITL